MAKDKQLNEQKELVEKIGIGIEERLRLSPLASRIYALLILSSYDGLTFDDIRAYVDASKSSTSVNVNVLTQLGYVSYYTKSGDRKRYFKLAKYSQITSLESELERLEIEMKMIERINTYNKEFHPEKYTKEESLGDIFQEYLNKKQALLDKTIEKMKRFRDSEK